MSREDGRQLMRVSSPLLLCNSKDPVQFVRFGTKHPHPLCHLIGPKATNEKESVLVSAYNHSTRRTKTGDQSLGLHKRLFQKKKKHRNKQTNNNKVDFYVFIFMILDEV